MNDPRTDSQIGDDTGGRPSDMLRKAREEHKLTQQEVATRLHLDLRIITAIDNGQFTDQASPAYTRGYLRSYARLLKIDAEPIIEAYNREAEQIPPILPHASAPAQQVESSDALVKGISWLVGIVLLALLLLWARERFTGQELDFSLSDLGLRQSRQDEAPAPAESVLPTPAPMAQPVPGEPVTGTESFRRLEQTVHPGPGSITKPPREETPASDRPGTSALTPEELAASADEAGSAGIAPTEAPAGTAEPALPEPAMAPASSGPELALQLADKAWIEITDADGKRLYYNLGKPGETIAVSGKLPYTVKIGHAGSVTAQLGGQRLDLGPYSADGVARLRINGPDDIVENR